MPRLMGNIASLRGLLAHLPMVEGLMGTWVPGKAAQVAFAAGKVCSALQLNGVSGSYISTPYDEAFNLQEFSIALWIKAATTQPSWVSLFHRRLYTSGNFYGVNLALDESPNTGYCIFNAYKGSGSTRISVTSAVNYLDDLWHHLCVRCNGTTLELFIDAVLADSDSWADTIAYSSVRSTIGADNIGANRLNGLIDEFYLFNRFISTAELQRIYRLSQVKFWHRRQQAL